ncbi:MAG: YgiQ family radical SAM protein [Bacteroidales bacterium]|nr:YgiQ family radical SAM protein [Bacteroidales bacterium]MBQ5605238.1 YgiQ family radical SAM protein [Bacteroidales bacterium]
MKRFLPTTKKEMEMRGWDEVDVILFSGDAYVDHPSFGSAVVGRLLEAGGLRVAIVPQPDWRGDFRDFKKLGRPRMFFAISAGCMDSMVNRYTANKRLRSDDAYTPEGRAGARPDYTTVTYANIIKQLYPDVPLVIGGIEASMRRLSHYDYWSDSLKPSILIDSKADLLMYGMGEINLKRMAEHLLNGGRFEDIKQWPQVAYLRNKTKNDHQDNIIRLHSHEDCLNSKRKHAENFRHIEEESNKMQAATLIQSVGNVEVVVNPPYPPMSEEQLDASFDLPYTRLPHPKYKGKVIPAYEMIKHSVCLHRGCFGGCSFCAISAHQGKFIVSRSKESILREVKQMIQSDDFKGYLSDLGGPSANMYRMAGRNIEACKKCKKPSCIHPQICPNLNVDHKPLLDIYRSVDALPGIKKSFIGSGVRYDLLLHSKDASAKEYTRELIENHVSGRLKVAPEHTEDRVLNCMRKPSFEQFIQFKKIFDKIENQRLQEGKGPKGRQELVPYFISSHPACSEIDMAQLAVKTKHLNFHLEQVQDFTPTPMTLATEMYYTGYDPYTLKPVFTAKNKEDKLNQRRYFFWYKAEERAAIIRNLKKLGCQNLIRPLLG